jgi:hypothetical protein
VRLALALLVTLLALAAGCGGDEGDVAAPPPTLSANAVPELASEKRELDRAALAEDAFTPAELAELLADAGYVDGVEREFVGRSAVFDRVVARSLRFESPEGAGAYLAWVRSHGDELVGETVSRRPLGVGSDGVLLALVPCGTCKKELPTLLAAWRREDVALSLFASGRGVDRERVAVLARELDARMQA